MPKLEVALVVSRLTMAETMLSKDFEVVQGSTEVEVEHAMSFDDGRNNGVSLEARLVKKMKEK